VRGPTAGAARLTRETRSSRGSRTDDRQLRRHCCGEEDRVAFPPRAGATSAMRGKRRSRARASHVCSSSIACSRHVRARAQLEEAAMGTQRNVGICVPAFGGYPGPRGAARTGESVFAPGEADIPAARAASIVEEHRRPGHRDPTADSSWQARHTRRLWARSQLSGGAEPADRWTERRWLTRDCKQPQPVGEAPSRRAHRSMGQNQMPDGWTEAGVRDCDRGLPGCIGGSSEVPPTATAAASTSMELVPGGPRIRGLAGRASAGWPGSVPVDPSGMPIGDVRAAESGRGAPTGGGGGRSVQAGRVGHEGNSRFRRPGSRVRPWARPFVWYVIRGVNCRVGDGGGCRRTVRSGEEEARDSWGDTRGSAGPLPLPVAQRQGVRVSVRYHEVRTRVLG